MWTYWNGSSKWPQKTVKGSKFLTYNGRLRELGPFNLEKRWLREISCLCIMYLIGGSKEDGTRLSGIPGDSTRGNEHRFKYRKITLSIRKINQQQTKHFTVGLVKH